MKTKRVATLNAGIIKPIIWFETNWKIFGLIGILLTVSCSKNDEEEIIIQDPPANYEAVIIYTDVEPDFSSEALNTSYNLDLNNDKNNDFTITLDSYEDWGFLEIFAITYGGIISVDPWYTNCIPLENESKIYNLVGSKNGERYASGGIISVSDCVGNLGTAGCGYDWSGKNDKYLGLRIKINGKMHYGWARMNVTSLTQWVVKDYAYNATPNMPILAGQME